MTWLRNLIIAASAALVMIPHGSLAWGNEGHRVVALIAASRLTTKARSEVERLLGGPASSAMADASTWADEIKPQRPETRPWHYIDIPINDLVYRPSLCPNDACVTEQIERDLKIIGDKTLLKPVRVEALKFLIHFVGDEHQPLHCGENHDTGGNDVKVLLNGSQKKLHAVWDGDVVEQLGRDDQQLANNLRGKIGDTEAQAWSSGTPISWCLETANVAKNTVYAGLAGQGGTTKPIVLPADYLSKNAAVTSRQLQRAGVRLAEVLNNVLR